MKFLIGPKRTLHQSRIGRTIGSFLICLATFLVAALLSQQPAAEAMWFFQEPSNETLANKAPALQLGEQQKLQQQQQEQQKLQQVTQELVTSVPDQQAPQKGGSNYASYGSSLLSIAGIQPSSIASILNTVGDTGFRYFNIQDQCRNRAACDLGYMLYKRLSFVHNWLIRTSVRTLTDMNNVYTQSWMEGMLGRNCTFVYMACRQSPLEGLMNLALLQHLAT